MPTGEARGRFYTASDELKKIRAQARTADRQIEDPYELTSKPVESSQLSVGI